jgi:MFS family permease
MANAAIAPAIAVIGKEFSDVASIYVKMLITFPAIFIIPLSLLSGKLVQITSKRNLVVLGTSLYIIGGFGAFFLTSFWIIFAFRGILGIGVGILTPLAVGLISDYYNGVERSKMMGYATSFNNLGGIIATVFAGLLSTYSYRYPHLVYILGFFVLVMAIFVLPKGDKVISDSKVSITKKVIYLALAMAGLMIVFYQIPSHLSIYVMDLGFGTGFTSGLLISVVTFGSFIFGLMFHNVRTALGKYTNSTGMLLMLLGNYGIYMTSSMLVLSISLFLVGISLGILIPNIYLSTTLVSKGDPTFSLGVIASLSFLGQFLSPIMIDSIIALFKLTKVRDPFMISVWFAAIGLIIVFSIKNKEFLKE